MAGLLNTQGRMKEEDQRIPYKDSIAIRNIKEAKSMEREILLSCFPGDDIRWEVRGKYASWTVQRVPVCTYKEQRTCFL